MNMVQTYTEQKYSTREEVIKEFDLGVGDVIWNEILKYRKQFNYSIECFSTPYELVLCRSVLWNIMKIEQQIMEFMMMCKDAIPDFLQIGIWKALADEQNQILYKKEAWLNKACARFALQEASVVQELLKMDTFFTLRLFLCCFLNKQDQQTAASLLFLCEHRNSIIDLTQDKDLFMGVDVYKKDITYAFLEFLKQLELKISQRMVLLKGSKKSNEQTMGLVTLKERFPQFSDEQLAFYAAHRSIQHYYTIQQYAACCHVCYETARYSLDQLVEIGWYQKQKIGKKFVYYV